MVISACMLNRHEADNQTPVWIGLTVAVPSIVRLLTTAKVQVEKHCLWKQLAQQSTWLLQTTCSKTRCLLPLQEISDDVGRHRSDAQVNNTPCTVLRGADEVATQWHKLQVGDLVKVYQAQIQLSCMHGTLLLLNRTTMHWRMAATVE